MQRRAWQKWKVRITLEFCPYEELWESDLDKFRKAISSQKATQ